VENPDLTFGSEDVNDIHHESPLASRAQEWLKDDHDDVEAALDMDIFKIADACLRTVKNLWTKKSLKMITQLTAVTQYVKLREQYRHHPKCKTPCLSASLAIAQRMGKGKKGTGV
jgi:asparagine synthetase A